MAARPVSAEIYTTSHRILGRLNPGASGLFSFLNIPTRSFLEVEGAILSRMHQPNRMVARFPTIWLVKQEVVAVLVSSRVELGPSVLQQRGYVSRATHRLEVVLGGYELRGSVETAGKFNFSSLMFEGDSLFIPLYEAELTAILFANIKAQSPALLFNRRMVDAIGLLPRKDLYPESP